MGVCDDCKWKRFVRGEKEVFETEVCFNPKMHPEGHPPEGGLRITCSPSFNNCKYKEE
jgi:hypothetical protein